MQKEKDMSINEFRTKYDKKKKKNYENYSVNEVNCLNKILENTFSVDKFKSYINKDFLDNCEYKLIFMPDEFNMKEDDKYYFQGFGDKRHKKINNAKNKTANKNISPFAAKKNKFSVFIVKDSSDKKFWIDSLLPKGDIIIVSFFLNLN